MRGASNEIDARENCVVDKMPNNKEILKKTHTNAHDTSLNLFTDN